MPEPRIIKRYANRKLYDTARSRYVTLEQIAEMVREGEDVRIVDNTSKEDLTSVTLAQIILEEEKRQKSFLPLQAMRELIQSKGASFQELMAQAGGKVRSAFGWEKRDEEGAGEGQGDEAGVEGKIDPAVLVREFVEASQKTFEEWQRRLDERVRQAIETVSPFASLQREVQALSARVAELERRIEEQERAEKDRGDAG